MPNLYMTDQLRRGFPPVGINERKASAMAGSFGLVAGAVSGTIAGALGVGISYLAWLLWGWIHGNFGWPGTVAFYGGIPFLFALYRGSQLEPDGGSRS